MNARPRREFSAKTKTAAWERAGGQCEGTIIEIHNGYNGRQPFSRRCNAPVDIGCFHYDHIDPDWFSKDNELENCQVLCRTCHAAKTKKDVKNIAKAKRIIAKRTKTKKPRGRPLPGTKRSGWKKGVGGKVERR